MKNITKSQYYLLFGLKTLAAEYDKKMNDIQRCVAEIFGEEYGMGDGWSGELVFTTRDLDDTLRCANIVVVEEGTDE